MHTFKRSALYSIIQFVSILIIFVIWLLLTYNSGITNITNILGFFGELIIAVGFMIYAGIVSFTKVEIDENYIYIRKIYGFKRFGLEEITHIEYKRLGIKLLSSVKVHNIDGDSILLEYGFENLSGLLSVLCKNTLLKNSNVLISDYIRKQFLEMEKHNGIIN